MGTRTSKSAGTPKSKLVNGQRINIKTGQKMQSSVSNEDIGVKTSKSNPTGRTVQLAGGSMLSEADALEYGKNSVGTIEKPTGLEDKTNPLGSVQEPPKPVQPQVGTSPATLTGEQALKDFGYSNMDTQEMAGAQSWVQKGFQQMKDTPAPAVGGDATALSYQPPAPQTSVADGLFADDTGGFWGSLQSEIQDYFSPKNQRESLTKEYQKMLKKSGVEEMDMELIDMKNVIDGSEDDIRNEITKAGGFATDSNVLALTNARNKQLIKNYNTLLETRNAKQQYLDKMMDLSVEDRRMADADFDRKMNFAFKIQDYRDKMKANAKDSYEKLGYPALLKATGGDPYYTSLVEKTLGFPPGGLAAKAAEVEAETRLDTEYKKAQIANIYSTIRDREDSASSSGTISGKPQTATQAAANSYANRLAESNIQISNLGSKFTGKFALIPTFNFLKTADRQIYEQAQKNFITAVLRRESGASIAPTEFDTAKDVYFPQPGDTPEVVAQKERTRNVVINNFYREADVLRPVLPGDIVEENGKRYRVGMDGETLESL